MGFFASLSRSIAKPLEQLGVSHGVASAIGQGPIGVDNYLVNRTGKALGGTVGRELERESQKNLDHPERAVGRTAAVAGAVYGGMSAYGAYGAEAGAVAEAGAAAEAAAEAGAVASPVASSAGAMTETNLMSSLGEWGGATGGTGMSLTPAAQAAGGWGTAAQAAGATTTSLAGTAGGAAGSMSALGGWGELIKGGLGMYQAYQLSQMGKGSASSRAADAQLTNLLQDPSSITSTPGYQAGLDAVERKAASQGYLGSGNMMIGLAKYAGDFYSQQLSQLGQLANGGRGVDQAYQIAGTQLFGQSVNSMSYGIAKLFGG
jgi:hypothetical protein